MGDVVYKTVAVDDLQNAFEIDPSILQLVTQNLKPQETAAYDARLLVPINAYDQDYNRLFDFSLVTRSCRRRRRRILARLFFGWMEFVNSRALQVGQVLCFSWLPVGHRLGLRVYTGVVGERLVVLARIFQPNGIPRRRRSARVVVAMEGNNLPGNILGHTLSLLPSKYAVATSNLSANQLTTDCDFDDSLSIHPQFRFGAPNRNSCFRNFVNRVLVQCKKSQITRFEYSLVTDWINVALYLHKVTKIELSVELGLPFVLRLPELTCQNLTVSKLDCNFILHVPKLVTFPFLKVLFFKEVSFLGDSTLFPSNGELRMDGSLSGSPLLEELVIIGCDWNGSDLFFSNPLPKKLTLDVGIGGVLEQLNGSSIHFNLLSLVYLKYSESVPEQYYISNLDSLVHGHFEVGFDDDEFEDLQDLCNTMLDVIFGVSNCQILYLFGQCLETLTACLVITRFLLVFRRA
ncbi:F-box/LRR-repeat protein At3g58900-like isoform X2 [Silene latifolia]|uniref:F-box/LRR-repeat protein At3g58900-like isoform X2 n=1 Tax=Silene latifolia TaxID=37657 RepID=UPI003D76E7FE